jgi:hypothetical protein
MITFAKGFLILGALAGILGLLGILLLAFAWWQDRRSARQPILTPRRKRNFPANSTPVSHAR